MAWHDCRHSCRCSGVKGSARKGRLGLGFASARCLEIVCGTIATPTSARIGERITVGSTSACRTILQSCLLVVFLVALPMIRPLSNSLNCEKCLLARLPGMFRLPKSSYNRRVLDESRSFFRVHTGYFSNIPKCIKAEFIASWACSQSSVVSSSKR
ncbi:uncharacterized protein TNCV_2509971 [Trichonephila clavipes]|nr:uncharacterized protein TNCV_2509971 [Trichonephila clavipes]